MLHLNELTYRLGERLLIDGATVALPTGAHVGLIGRNGAGKTTLFRLICGELAPESGAIGLPRRARVGRVEQEAPGGAQALIDFVLDADAERRVLLEEAERADDPLRIAEIQTRLVDIDAHAAPARAARILAGLGFDERAQGRPLAEFSGGWRMRVALAAVLFSAPRPAAARRADQLPRPRGRAVARRLSQDLPGDDPRHQPRPRPARRRRRPHPALERGKLTLWSGGYSELRAPAAREPGAAGQGAARSRRSAASICRAFVDRFRAKATKATPGAVAAENAGQDGADRRGGRRNRRAVPLAADRQETQPADHRDGEGQRRLRRPRRAVEAQPDARRRRPHRAARRQRQRQIDLRQAARRTAGADGGQARRAPTSSRSASSPSTRSTNSTSAATPYGAVARAHARRGGGQDPRPRGADRLSRRARRHQDRRAVGRREGAAADGPGRPSTGRNC